MKRSGILGGTFDPIHNGHMAMAELTFTCLGLDELILLPAGNPYFKKGITPYAIRFEMCRLAAEDSACRESFYVSDLESDESRPTYTYETLGRLKEEDPERELYFICGADVLQTIHTWKRTEEIFALAKLAVFEREGSESTGQSAKALKERYPRSECVFINGEVPDISSTMVRNAVKAGEDISGLVSEGVRKIIYENKLYVI